MSSFKPGSWCFSHFAYMKNKLRYIWCTVCGAGSAISIAAVGPGALLVCCRLLPATAWDVVLFLGGFCYQALPALSDEKEESVDFATSWLSQISAEC